MNYYINIFFRFIVIVLLQVLILNNITVVWWLVPSGFPPFSPIIYPLLILVLPFETPIWLLLLTGFFTGLTVDAFMNTAGIHALVTVVVAYMRTAILTTLLPRSIAEYSGLEPTVKIMSWVPYLVYCAIIVITHHLLLYAFLNWSVTNLPRLSLQVLCSTVTTMLMILAYVLLFTRREPMVQL
jgi:hypothetical protein